MKTFVKFGERGSYAKAVGVSPSELDVIRKFLADNAPVTASQNELSFAAEFPNGITAKVVCRKTVTDPAPTVEVLLYEAGTLVLSERFGNRFTGVWSVKYAGVRYTVFAYPKVVEETIAWPVCG